MFKRKKAPNYLRIISLVIMIVIILYLIAVAMFIFNFNEAKNQHLKNLLSQKNLEKNLISQNLISYLKDDRIFLPQEDAAAPTLGDPKAPITIYEYSGFDCGYSQTVQPILKTLLQKYQGQVKLVWKDLPLNSSAETVNAHLAAYCAQEQNKFWQYHDLLWQNQKNFSSANLSQLAKNLKLNLSQFNNCLEQKKYLDQINKNIAEADELLIPGTPHFYINDQEKTGLITLAEMEQAILAELPAGQKVK